MKGGLQMKYLAPEMEKMVVLSQDVITTSGNKDVVLPDDDDM